MIKIKICEDYTDAPGGRYIKEGKYSGEDFRDSILLEKYDEAVRLNEKLIIDFDGCYGFGTSFLEEAFGGLVRKYNRRGVWKNLKLTSEEDETIPKLVKKYIEDAENSR